MSTRWRLFFSYVAVIVVLVTALSLAVRSLAIHAVTSHVAGMGRGSGGMRDVMTEEIRAAISAGVNQGVLWGALAALVAAVIASYLVSGWITRPLTHMADAAGKIAAGDFGQRVSHSRRDEIGRFAVARGRHGDDVASTYWRRFVLKNASIVPPWPKNSAKSSSRTACSLLEAIG